MKYETPESVVSAYWDDPLIKSDGGPIFPPEDEIEQAIFGN